MTRLRGPVAVCVTAAAIVSVLMGTASGASAAAPSPAPALQAFGGGAAALALGAVAATPSAVAGYLPTVPRTKQVVSARINVPAITCSTAGTMIATLVGVGSTKATGTGGGYLAGYLESGCRGTTPYYRATVVDRNGAVGPVLTVAAGDQLVVTARAGRSPSATLTDRKDGQRSTGVTSPFVADLAQFTVQAIGSPFPTFTRYGFGVARVGTESLQALNPTKNDQVSTAGKVQLRTSAVTTAGGFTVKYISQG